VKLHSPLSILVLLFLAGCATHYHELKDSSLNLYLRAPKATVVYFSSSLEDFEPRKAERILDHTWKVTVPSGMEFTYFYIVDGKVHIPPCRLKEKDDFGGGNCVYVPEM
jgi:hypothetical protein